MNEFEAAFSGLRAAVGGDAGDSGFALEPSPASSASGLLERKKEVLAVLDKWRLSARTSGRRQAEADCEMVIGFIREICPESK